MRVGVDIVEIGRIIQTVSRFPSFLHRVYTDQELQMGNSLRGSRRHEFLAGRFAAKEAVAKALRIGIGGGAILKEIEIVRRLDGSPQLHLHGSAHQAARDQRLDSYEVSISHDAGVAVGFAVFQ